MPPGIAGRQTAPFEIPKCVKYYPTMEEFKDFNKYMEYLESQGAHHAGVAIVVPPKEWVPRKTGYNIDDIGDTEINGPIKQYFKQVGGRGCYQTKGIVQQKTTVKEYYNLCNSSQFRTPNHSSYEDLERKYWKTLSFCPPIYGCDVAESITDEDQESWNIRDLGSILNMVNEDYDQTIKGVNSPYLYFGMWKATFSWHVEDMDLHSINYIHHGQPKTWYVVPPKYGYLMERAARKLFPNVASWCSNFMRHKTCLISPQLLDQMGVPYQRVVQEERNAIIVFPYAYHSGFNHGFNIAESTNFALPRWIEYGKRARQCDCSRSRVTFSMDTFVKRFQPEKYEDWKNGRDIAPHPEDPEEVRQEIMLRANNPAEYAKMMQERMWLGDKNKKKGAKPRNTCPLPENNDENNSNSANNSNSSSTNFKTFQVYQHHEYHMVRILVNPETMKCFKGMTNLKEKMMLEEEPDIPELIRNSILIHVDDETVDLAAAALNGKRSRGQDQPKEILQDVDVYAHKTLPNLEANVHPVTLTLVGEQSKELTEYLADGNKDMRTEITDRNNFEFKYNGSVRIPNPDYVAGGGSDVTGNGGDKPSKRIKTAAESSSMSKLERITMGDCHERIFITANIYQHVELKELITLKPDGNYMGGPAPSKELTDSLEGHPIQYHIEAGTLLKVGERKVNLTAKITDLRHGVFAFGDDAVKVEVAAGRTSMVYKLRTGEDAAVRALKDNPFGDLVNARLLIRKQTSGNESAGKSLPSDSMLTALANPCYISKCDSCRQTKKILSSAIPEADRLCGCKIKGQDQLAKSLNASEDDDIIVVVDEVTSTVTLLRGNETLIVKREEQAPMDMLDSAQETAQEAKDEGVVVSDSDSDSDSMDDEDSDEENQAFTSDEEQESDAESSDDPDFQSGHRFDNYSWKHSSAMKKNKKKLKRAAFAAKMRARRMRAPGDHSGADGRRGRRGGGGNKGAKRKQILGYEEFLTVAKKILERFENGGPEVTEDMIVASDLATAIEEELSNVSKCLELFKLFEIMEQIDGGGGGGGEVEGAAAVLTYQWVSRDSVRLEHFLRRVYHEKEEEGEDKSDIWTIVRGVVKCLLQSRRDRRFYINRIVQDLFSIDCAEEVNWVLATMELLKLVTKHKGRRAGFEYIGPILELGVQEPEEQQTRTRTRTRTKDKGNRPPPSKRARLDPSLKEQRPTDALEQVKQRDWDAERIQLERERSVKYADVTCSCGTSKEQKPQKIVNPMNTKDYMIKTKVHVGFFKRSRCYHCTGCKAEKCGSCQFCVNPQRKKPCVKKKCLYPVIPRGCPCFP